LELIRKCLLEGNLRLVKVILKEYNAKFIQTHPVVKKIVESGTLLKPLASASLQSSLVTQHGATPDVISCLVVFLRELERYVEFMNMRELYQDFTRASSLQALQLPKFEGDVAALEKRALNLVACQPV